MTAEQTLVIFLSSALFAFLLLAIIAIIYFIKLLKELNVITKKAQGVVDNAESVSRIFQYSIGSVAATKIFSNLLRPLIKNNSQKTTKK